MRRFVIHTTVQDNPVSRSWHNSSSLFVGLVEVTLKSKLSGSIDIDWDDAAAAGRFDGAVVHDLIPQRTVTELPRAYHMLISVAALRKLFEL